MCVCVFYTLISLIHAYLSFQVIHIATTPIMLPLSHPGSPISALLTSLPLDALVSELFMSSFSFFRSFVCSFLQKLLPFLRVWYYSCVPSFHLSLSLSLSSLLCILFVHTISQGRLSRRPPSFAVWTPLDAVTLSLSNGVVQLEDGALEFVIGDEI